MTHYETISTVDLEGLHEAAAKLSVTKEDLDTLNTLRTTVDRAAFKEHGILDEDLRAMFHACEQVRVEVQKNRGKIQNYVLRDSLEALDGELTYISSISPWQDHANSTLEEFGKRRSADDNTLAQWAEDNKITFQALATKNDVRNSDPRTVMFWELRNSQERIVGILQTTTYLAGTFPHAQ
jgi:hypothetical protein